MVELSKSTLASMSSCRKYPDENKVKPISVFESVMRNLVLNAVKFTHKEGKVIITATAISNNTVEISIKDTGIGMNKEMPDKLFQLDANIGHKGTEGEPGTGLGLFICKDFVEKQGGKLRVESEEEKGSNFLFTLPAKANNLSVNKV